MIAKLPKIALWLAVGLVLWFAAAVFGPKFGLIDWRFALGTMVREWGPILIGITALVAVIALVAILWKGPRGQWWKAALALAIPAALMGGLASVASTAESVPPIHDVATDVTDPPQFTEWTREKRAQVSANPLNDYATPLGELDAWSDMDSPLASQSHAQIIAESYPDLATITYSGDASDAMVAVALAMEDIGLSDVTSDVDGGRVEGVAETFLFGFKDDVVARVRDGEIDLRSVSRVGLSDLGYNAARLRELSEAIENRLSE
ncbi:DUF1499 domain-containing protein [Erythrobacter aquimaris]|uniref:DUF1499 domain-containing protein n=1 Tax=Qipengyuania aquimaris TaxID=255984 RepID=A0A6I4TGK9_9SPHN|nr:DUF1499 domain-containing protein [Qipengyuania aquimaris]MXO95025.1 DUF1499 domain-containing protein [Qipengyuania aquimaris]